MKFKEKPPMGKPKAKPPSALNPRQAARQMKEKYLRELDQRPEGPENETGYATGQVEDAGHWAADALTDAAMDHRPDRQRRQYAKEKARPGAEQPPQSSDAAPTGEGGPARSRPANAPKERPAANAIKQRTATVEPAQFPVQRPAQTPGHAPASIRSTRPGRPPAHTALNNKRRGVPAALHRPPATTGPRSAQSTPIGGGRGPRPRDGPRRAGAIKQRTRAAPKTRASLQTGTPARANPLKLRPSAARGRAARAVRAARQTAQRHMTRQMVAQAQRAAKGALAVTKKLVQAVVKAAAALVSALAGLVGGGVLLVALVIVIVIAAVANSPFGLFFAAEPNAPDTVSISQAVAQVNMAYNARLEELQAGDYDGIVIHGQAPDWPDVLAVFSARYAGADDGVDVATLDPDRVGKLTNLFWDMTAITTQVETIDHPGDEDSEGWTEYILHISITSKTADDMRAAYAFTDYQNSALDELLADRAALASLAGSLTITSADVRAVLDALPADLSPERRKAVETALSLVGKVNYFWGGKSLVLGWDSRWGQLAKVWAEGNSTTGTYRPYGLDCSGFVDWVFYNLTGGEYIIGHGGGAIMQHTYCTNITWAEAQAGDLVFYPEDEHVGIVCGRDGSGDLLAVHCASGANNVVITGVSGFTSVARPTYYETGG